MTVPDPPPTFQPPWPEARVALCHDWLTGMRGGERVLELLCQGYPSAPIYTLLANRAAVSDTILRHPIHTSWLQYIPRIHLHYRMLLPLFPSAIHNLKPESTEVLISTSHCVAKSIRSAPACRHICYCFTPMRYAWTFQDEYLGASPLKKQIAKPILAALRQWDARTAARVDTFIAISHHVRKRIEAHYHREAQVIYPPVDTDRCTPGPTSGAGTYDLIVSALVPYKRIDLAIEAYNRSGFPLRIIGTGGLYQTLKAKARPNISMEGWQSDAHVLDCYRNCRFLIFPGEEDFGIVPLEAQACGKPVVAFGRGGACETVKDGQTGIFFPSQEAGALAEAVQQAASMQWDAQAIRQHATSFSNAAFIQNMSQAIRQCL